jgi:SAM-dependent methyltransferase
MKPFADHFSRISTGYAAFRPRYPEPLFDALAAAAPGRRLAWDCATGTGQAALGLARRFERVIATDASAAQVRRGAQHPGLHYVAARAEAGVIRHGTADLVTVAQALHWLELGHFYAEARRALAPRGVIAVWTYGRHGVDGGEIDRVLDHFYQDVVGPYWPPERRWVEAGYRGLPFPFREETVVPPPMAEDWTLDQMLGYIATWSAVVRCRETTGRDPVAGLADRLAPLWGDRRRRVHWVLTIRAGRP